jgi:D-alanyl-D-alanine carboxypeptidase
MDLVAPLEENTPCGSIKITDGVKTIATQELYTATAVQKAGLVEKAKNWWASN